LTGWLGCQVSRRVERWPYTVRRIMETDVEYETDIGEPEESLVGTRVGAS
jgi:hypothetical protein